MNFIESSKTKILRYVGNGLIVAASFIMVIMFGSPLFVATTKVFQYLSGEELVDTLSILLVAISLYVVAPLIVLILGVTGLFKKNIAVNMVASVFAIMCGLLACLVFYWLILIIAAIELIGGILIVIAAVNLSREKALYETNVLGYQQPSATIFPRPGIRQPFPTPQPPMSQPTPMKQQAPMPQPIPMPQRPTINNQPQQPVSQPVVNQPNTNIDNIQEQ